VSFTINYAKQSQFKANRRSLAGNPTAENPGAPGEQDLKKQSQFPKRQMNINICDRTAYGVFAALGLRKNKAQ
jgi:hypothetical protein